MILADLIRLSDPVEVAIIAAIGGIIVALINNGRVVRKRIGKPNGRGNVTEMASASLEQMEKLHERLDLHEQREMGGLIQVQNDLRAYRDDQVRQLSNLRSTMGGVIVDMQAITDLRGQIRLLRDDLDSLARYKEETRTKVAEINHRLDEIANHKDLAG